MSSMLEALKRDKNRGRATIKVKRLITSDDGKYNIQIFPDAENPEGLPYYKVFLHFGFNHPNYGNPGTFRCLGRDCPLCREAKKLKESKNPNAWRFSSTPVFLYYVLDSQGVIKYLRLSSTAHDAVVDALIEKQKSKINPILIENNRPASFEVSTIKDKNKEKKSYKLFFAAEAKEIPAKRLDEFHQLQPLEEIYRVWTKDDLEKVVKGEKIVFGRPQGSESQAQNISNKNISRPMSGVPSRQEIPGVDDGTMDSIQDEPEESARPAMLSGGDYDPDDKPSKPVETSEKKESLEEAKARIRASLGED